VSTDRGTIHSCRTRSGAAGLIRYPRLITAIALALLAGLLLRSLPSPARAAQHPHVDRPACVAFAPLLPTTQLAAVSGGDSKKVIHWDLSKTPPDKLGEYKKQHLKKVSYVAVSLNPVAGQPTKLFQASYDGDVAVSALGKYQDNPLLVYSGHYPAGTADKDKPEVWVVTPSADGSLALSATNQGEIKLWKADTGETLATLPASGDPVGGLAFMPPPSLAGQKQQFLAGHGDGRMVLYEIDPDPTIAGKFVFTEVKAFSHDNPFPVNSVAVTSTGNLAVSASFDMTIRIWDVANGTEVPGSRINEHKNFVWRVAISPHDQKIASASEDGTVMLFHMDGTAFKDANGKAVQSEAHGVMGVAFIDDNKVVYTTGSLKDPGGVKELEVKTWDISGYQ
jgi:WD40 repeat protein